MAEWWPLTSGQSSDGSISPRPWAFTAALGDWPVAPTVLGSSSPLTITPLVDHRRAPLPGSLTAVKGTQSAVL